MGLLIRGREELYITTQNVAEFWNVATRPVANNGLALAPEAAGKLFDDAISAICTILPERDDVPAQLRRLLSQHQVVGKQVHDARLVALMLSWQVENILTLNARNFRRFESEGIAVVEPAAIGR